ncbi:hypothetical protein [Deinococcus hohokamensis]|uniref:Uncharacterized protein n=1 Tax=Deinococcus hohokamensis TaxID=309883 RepID=A0ABV9I3K9_9DEIO
MSQSRTEAVASTRKSNPGHGRPATPEQRRAAEAISCLSGIVDMRAFEDAEEMAATCAVTLHYDPATRLVLRGPCRGMNINQAVSHEVCRLMRSRLLVRVRDVTRRPWWRFWQQTRAKCLIPQVRLEDFTAVR